MISFMHFHVILSVDLFAKEERYGNMRSPAYSTRELVPPLDGSQVSDAKRMYDKVNVEEFPCKNLL